MSNDASTLLGDKLVELKTKFKELEAYVNFIREVQIIEYQKQIQEHFYSLKNEIDIKRETVLQKFYEKNEIDSDFIERVQCSSANLIKV